MYSLKTGEGRKCLAFTPSVPSVSQLGFEAIHMFQAEATSITVHALAFSGQSEPRGVILHVSGFPANVQLLRLASPGVL